MKERLGKYLPIVLSSLLSALTAVMLYRYLEPPRQVIVREVSPASYAAQGPEGSNTVASLGEGFYQKLAPTEFTQAAGRVTSAVVNIKTVQGRGSLGFMRSAQPLSSSGSGVILSSDGYIVTNYHVVEDAGKIIVTFSDKREASASFVGADPSTDLALIKVDAVGLNAISYGNSDSLQVGEWVLAVGNPFNLASTVTAGIVSAKGRSIDILQGADRIESFIQTDAAVNPGNSGGALVNTRGELVGINTAIITRSGRYEGYSFAVPSNLVRKVIEDIRDFGMVQRGLLGVFIEDLDAEKAQKLGLDAPDGVLITRVSPGSGAEDAGLRSRDVILSINKVRTPTVPKMQEQVGRYRPGNVLQIEYWRQGKRETARVTLKNKNNSTKLVQASDSELLQSLGAELRDLSQKERARLEMSGVKVLSIRKGTKLDLANMQPGFVITRVNNQRVHSLEQLLAELRQAVGSRVTLRGFYEGEKEPYYYVFDLQE